MIHSRHDYARIQDPWKKIPEDEPVFLLRAQDALAAPALLRYLSVCEGSQPAEMVAPLHKHIEAMIEWPKKKMPDVPEPRCACGAKAASECGPDDQWEPGCDLGNNPDHAVAFEPTVRQLQAAYALLQSKFEALQAAERALSESYVRIRRIVGAMNPPRLDMASLCEYVEGVVQERVRAESTAEPVKEAPSFQARVQPWMMACFGEEISNDRLERGDRFLEEALELLQSGGYPKERIAALTKYVYDRPVGEPSQEVGGVAVTLAAYCLAHNLDMHEAGEAELERIWTKIDLIRSKQAAKPRGSALPVADKFKLVPLVPTEEEVAKAMEAAYLEDQEWPNGDVAVVRAFTLHYKESA